VTETASGAVVELDPDTSAKVLQAPDISQIKAPTKNSAMKRHDAHINPSIPCRSFSEVHQREYQRSTIRAVAVARGLRKAAR